MADTTLYHPWTDSKEYVFIPGRFTTSGTVSAGTGFTVADSGTGIYTITFSDSYKEFVCFVASVGAATPANVDTYDVVHDDYTAATSTLPVTTSEAGTPTDIAASEYVSFIAVFRNSDLST